MLPDGRGLPVGSGDVLTGEEVFADYCATCHGAKLEGVDIAPGMSGARFDYTWRGKTAANLATHIRSMPPETVAEPISIDDKTYTNIQAFILFSNGFKSNPCSNLLIFVASVELKTLSPA